MPDLEAMSTLRFEIVLRSGRLCKIDERLIRHDAIILGMDDADLPSDDVFHPQYRAIKIRRDELPPIRRTPGPIRSAETGRDETDILIKRFILPFFFPIDDRGDRDDFFHDRKL